jgi:hypothetical protein
MVTLRSFAIDMLNSKRVLVCFVDSLLASTALTPAYSYGYCSLLLTAYSLTPLLHYPSLTPLIFVLSDFGSDNGRSLLVGKKNHDFANVSIGLWNQHFFEQVDALSDFRAAASSMATRSSNTWDLDIQGCQLL